MARNSSQLIVVLVAIFLTPLVFSHALQIACKLAGKWRGRLARATAGAYYASDLSSSLSASQKRRCFFT